MENNKRWITKYSRKASKVSIIKSNIKSSKLVIIKNFLENNKVNNKRIDKLSIIKNLRSNKHKIQKVIKDEMWKMVNLVI